MPTYPLRNNHRWLILPLFFFVVHFRLQVVITPLGGAQEVGRSCIHLQWRNRSLLLYCGLHPAFKGPHALPYLGEVDLEAC